ncbi:MAG: acetylornithine deacetylase, partial [Eudoraea sp.]
MKNLLTCFSLLILWINNAQDLELKAQVRHTIDELREFVAIPNDALDHSDINRNLSWLTKKFNERGFNSSVLPTEGESLFFAALPMEDDKPTILFYMHFDG